MFLQEFIELLHLSEERVLLVLKRIDALGDCQFLVITENDVQCDVGEEVRVIFLLTFIIKLVDITSKLVFAVDNLLDFIELRRSIRDVECSVNKSLFVNYYTDDNFVFVHNLKYFRIKLLVFLIQPKEMCDECACCEHSYCGYETIENDNHIF